MQKDMTLKDESAKLEGLLLGKSRGQLPIAQEIKKPVGKSRKNSQLWMCPVVKVKFNAIKHNSDRM